MLFPGDIYASLKGATKDGKMIGSVARVPPSVASGRLTQDTVKLVFRNPNLKDASYLYWILRTPQYREYCAGHSMGSAVVALSRPDFLSYPVPPVTTDRKMAVALLDAIEERIELNRGMNETLEAMARAIFKSWFVDFDPVRAKGEGRDPNLPKHIADLFPDRFEESEAGEIPVGWELRSLDRVANFLNGLALQKFPQKGAESLPAIKIAQLRAGHTNGADRVGTNLPAEYVIEDGDVLFSWSGSLEVEIWCGGRGALNQHLFKVTSDKFPKWFYYLWTRHYLSDFQVTAADKATTMGHIQRQHLEQAKVFVPPRNLLDAMNQHLAPVIDKLIVNRVESRTLAALRDILLPKLISGELRIKDAESVLETQV
jgi:type I restriction enzyme, S subunit